MRKIAVLSVLILFMVFASGAQAALLSGDYLSVGVGSSGGLIDNAFITGIKFDPTGTGNFAGKPDFLKPGTPFEFYSIGIDGVHVGTAGYLNGNPFSLTTINLSGASTAYSYSFNIGGLQISQVAQFDKSAKSIDFSVQFKNFGSDIKELVYARGLDPDQDVDLHGSYFTQNTILGPNKVKAVGPLSLLTIEIQDTTVYDAIGIPGISSFWGVNPYYLLTGPNDGNGDYTINMAWNLGELKKFATKEVDFRYNVNVVPIPAPILLLGAGLMGLVGLRKRFNK